jgi:hypothetical protein
MKNKDADSLQLCVWISPAIIDSDDYFRGSWQGK